MGMQTRTESSPVLVTGASGFIGSRLLSRLALAGEVHAVSRRTLAANEGEVRWWQADLSELDQARRVIAAVRPRLVFHLASEVTGSRELSWVQATIQSNLMAAVNVMTAAAETGVGRVVLAGSMEEPELEGNSLVPCSPYAAAKCAASSYARMFYALYQLDVVVLRLFMVYGPGQMDLRKLVPYVLVSCFRGERPKLSSGQRLIDWVYVEDVVEAFVRAGGRQGLGGKTVDVGRGEATSVRSVAESLAALANPSVGLELGALTDRPLECQPVADVARTEELLGWKAAVPLDEGLVLTARWYRGQWEQGRFRPEPRE